MSKWYRVLVEGHFNSMEDAEEAFNAMEDAVGKYNGELEDSKIQELSDE